MNIAVASPSFCKNKTLVTELLAKFPDAKLNHELTVLNSAELANFIGDARAAVIGTEPVTNALFEACAQLKVISKYGVGVNNIDFDAVERHGVSFLHTPGTNAQSVAEMTLAFMLALLGKLYERSLALRHGTWHKAGGVQLAGKTVGIIGMGHIGKRVAALLAPFNCHILVNDIVDQAAYYDAHQLTHVDKETLYKQADIITLHVPLTPETRDLIDANALALMKSTAVLINTCRSGVVVESALCAALADNRIGGVGIDVYDTEPLTAHPLLAHPNVFATPHIGGAAVESVLAMGQAAIAQLCEVANKN